MARAGAARSNVNGRTMVLDSAGTTAYILTASGLSIVPLYAVHLAGRPRRCQHPGVVNTANYLRGRPGRADIDLWYAIWKYRDHYLPAVRLPTVLGGACVTLNNVPLPLLATAPPRSTPSSTNSR